MPRQPRPDLRRQRDFEHRRAVGEHAIAEIADRRRGSASASCCSLRAQHLVVVAAERVARDERLRRIGEHRVARARRRRPVVHARGDHADRAGNELGGPRAGRAVACHIIHRAVAARGEPVEQSALPRRRDRCRRCRFPGSRAPGPSGGCRRRAPPSRVGAVRGDVVGERGAARASGEAYTTVSRAPSQHPMSTATAPPARCRRDRSGGRAACRRACAAGWSSRCPATSARARRRWSRGCLRALGWSGPVKSPSYTLVEHYPLSSLYFYHFDFYRFADPSEWETAGLADCFRDDAVCLIEWPERVAGLLPPPDLALTLAHPADPARAGPRSSRSPRVTEAR